jgi:hypothetical protein
MKNTYQHEFSFWQKIIAMVTTMWRINSHSVDFKWGWFAPKLGFALVLNQGGYFDQNCSLKLCLGWGMAQIALPFRTKLAEGCDMPRYGIEIHNDSVWLHWGGTYDESVGQMSKERMWSWDLPFVTWQNIEHVRLAKDGTWHPVSVFFNSRSLSSIKPLTIMFPYSYTLKSGEVQNVKADVGEIRLSWARKWAPFLKKHRRSIDIDFDQEVGERTGSWKGGVLGCSYDILPGEAWLAALRRMECDRVFN